MLEGMGFAEENWQVLVSLFPAGWQEGRCERRQRFREFLSPETLLRTLLLHVARGYSLRETAVQAKLANWVDVSDVALLKRLRNSGGSFLMARRHCGHVTVSPSNPHDLLTGAGTGTRLGS